MRATLAVTWLTLQSLPRRAVSALVVVAAIACTVGVLLSMLSMTMGLRLSWEKAGSPDRVMFEPQGNQFENGPISRADAVLLQDLPGIAHDAKGAPIADAELLTGISMPRRATGHRGYILMRTFGPRALELRPEFQIIAGRMFRPGSQELIVGDDGRGQFLGVDLGDKIIMPDGLWPVVGVFKSNDDVVQGELVGDNDTVMAAMRQGSFSSVIARLQSPGALATVKRALADNPALAMGAERHSDYYIRRAADFSDLNDALAYGLSALLGLGALFASVNILYSAVRTRRHEIATLRALGFSGFAVALSVAVEAVALAAIGAAIGAAIAYVLFNGVQDVWGSNTFHMLVTPSMIGLGFAWALIIGVLGGVVPALHAAHLPVALGLRPD